MQLTLDIPFSEATSALLSNQTLAYLLGLGQLSQVDRPLEAQLAVDFGLSENPDYPLAAISAAADGIEVSDSFWLRADPVHLLMQRDSFSLSEPAPLELMTEEADAIIATLNAHFAEDGLTFLVGKSGCWYVKTAQFQQVQTTLPAVATNKNVHDFMPTGQDAAKWRAIFNALQMLLHEHPVNILREQQKKTVVNSLWFSGGGVMPPLASNANKLQKVMAGTVLYAGLAKWANISYEHTFDSARLSHILNDAKQPSALHLRILMQQADHTMLLTVLQALKARKLQKLTIHIGFFERTLVLNLTPKTLLKWWRPVFWQALFKRNMRPLVDYLAR